MSRINRLITPLLAVGAVALSGCADLAYGPQRYEVVHPVRNVSQEEAVNFLRSQSELDAAERNARHSDSNHPALVGTGGLQFSTLAVREGESLLSVANRLMAVASYTRLIYDLSDQAPSPDAVKSKHRVTIHGSPSAFGEIASVYQEQFPGVQLYAALDGESHALVISDKGYARWSMLGVYDVQPGTLSDNARALSAFLGWNLPDNGWTAADFPIPHGYPIVIEVENARTAMMALLDRYPAQAQLNQNTGLVTVVGRPQP